MLKPNASEQCKPGNPYPNEDQTGKDLVVQLVLAFALGLFALFSFCVSPLLIWMLRCILTEAVSDLAEQTLRPRWPALYAARKRRLAPAVDLPELTKSFFGWMPRLWKVTEEQVLAAAGLDAFVVSYSSLTWKA
jgi:hypothetical protein